MSNIVKLDFNKNSMKDVLTKFLENLHESPKDEIEVTDAVIVYKTKEAFSFQCTELVDANDILSVIAAMELTKNYLIDLFMESAEVDYD